MSRGRIAVSIVLLQALSFLPQIVQAQNAGVAAETLFVKGQISLLQGDLKSAKSHLKAVLQIDKNFLAAYSELGKIALAEENWREGVKQFRRLLKRSAENRDAIYHLGICYRELGKNSGALLRRQHWQKAETTFLKILAHDSTTHETLHQLALLRKYQNRFREAVTLEQAQIRRRPDLPEPQIELQRLYEALINAEALKEAVDWLQQQPWKEAQLFIGEAFRHHNKLGSADSVFQTLLEAPLVSSRSQIYLMLAKNYYQQFNPERGEKYYWQAVAAIQTENDAARIFDDLKYAVSDLELPQYRALDSLTAKKTFFQQFWQHRDPYLENPWGKFNARLAEHYRRLRYAEQNYQRTDFYTPYNNPDRFNTFDFPPAYALNDRFNDKGLIYLRHGAPDESQITQEQQNPSKSAIESWRYAGTDAALTLHFALDDLVGAGGNWRFTTASASPQMVQDRPGWNQHYAALFTENDPLKIYHHEISLARESADDVWRGLITDRHSEGMLSVLYFMRLADSLFVEENFPAARQYYQQALKIYRDLTPAYLKLGKMAALEEDWHEAQKQYEEVLRRDTRHIEANYYLGICQRELGAFKIALLRQQSWGNAEKYFRRVMAHDSLYEDVIYQFALLQRDRGEYTEAIALGHEQVRRKPELPAAQVGLFGLYRYWLRHGEVKETRQWLKNQSSDEAQYFLGESLRRNGELAAAEAIFSDLLKRRLDFSRQPILLSLARTYEAQNLKQKTVASFWRAVNEITNHTDADFIFEDVKYLVTDEEWKNYRRQQTPIDKTHFFRRFWAGRDPTPAAAYNVRVAEHYRRLLYAEKEYEYDLWRNPLNRGGGFSLLKFSRAFNLNKEFNDAGLIYIRFGEPDDWATTVAAETRNMSWQYHGPEMTFHFYRQSPENNWQLTPTLSREMFADRADFDPQYFRLQNEKDPGRQMSLLARLEEESQASLATSMATDRHTWPKTTTLIDMPSYPATFRGELGQTVVEVYYGLPLRELIQKTPANITAIHVEKGLALHDTAWTEIGKLTRETVIQRADHPINNDEYFLDFLRLSAPANSYHVSLHAHAREADLLSGRKFEKLVLPDYSAPHLSASDLVLAYSIEPATRESKFVKSGQQIVPNPTRVFTADAPVAVYFEIYHLQQNREGQTAFSLEYTVSRMNEEKTLGIFGDTRKPSISLSAEREGNSEFAAEFITLDVSRLQPGDYTLMITIHDRQSKTKIAKSAELRLIRKG